MGTSSHPQIDSDAPALSRGLAILRRIAAAGAPVAFGELLDWSGIPRASLVRLLAVLHREAWLQRSPAGYRPGPAWAELVAIGPRADLGTRLRATAPPVLAELREATGNTAACFHWDGAAMTCIATAVHENALPMQKPGNSTDRLDDNPWGWLAATAHGLPLQPARGSKGKVRQALVEGRRRGFVLDDIVKPAYWVRLAAALPDQPVYLALGGNPLTLPLEAIATAGGQLHQRAEQLATSL